MSAVRRSGLPPKLIRTGDCECSNKNWTFTGNDDIKACKVDELRNILEACNLKKSGKKQELRARVWAHALKCHADIFVVDESDDE